jgi:uncharacterized protein (DUF1800 family)
LELFTLGVGCFSERDVQAAARALTGRTVAQGHYVFRPENHDDSTKTILGRTGQFDDAQLTQVLVAQPATAMRLAWRLCQAFLGENVADERAVGQLAHQLRDDQLHVGRSVDTILRSELFFSNRNLHSQIASPVSFVVGSVRALELFNPPPSTLVLAEWTRRIGQELFFPPNVGGWSGGRSWLSGRTVVARANFAAALVAGHTGAGSTTDPPDLLGLAGRHGRDKSASKAMQFFGELLLGRTLGEPACDTIMTSSNKSGGSDSERFNRAVALVLSRPEAQMT